MVCRIYVVHDEVKDKNFELELSWIGEGTERLACLLTIKLQNILMYYVYNLINYCKWRGLSLIKQSLLRYFAFARVIKINDLLLMCD